MAKLTWTDPSGQKWTSGVDRGVIYKANPDGTYKHGVAWNGLVSVVEQSSGGDVTNHYADNRVYMQMLSAEDFKGMFSSFTPPEAFDECDGIVALFGGMRASQQHKFTFGFCYRTKVYSATKPIRHIGYRIHLVYCATSKITSRSYKTSGPQVDDIIREWNFTTLPQQVVLGGVEYKHTAHVDLDSTEMSPENWKKLEDILYGDANNDARLPSIEEIYTTLAELWYVLIPNECGETCHFLRPYHLIPNECGETASL